MLAGRGLVVERVYLGTFLSALEMTGLSLSVMRVDDERLAFLDAPTDAPAWSPARPRRRPAPPLPDTPVATPTVAPAPPRTPLGQALGAAIQRGAWALIEAAARLTEMDQIVGDGDLGISLERGARAVLAALPSYPLDDPAATLHGLGVTLQGALGGTSGPLYAVLFIRAASRLRTDRTHQAQAWVQAFRAGCAAVSELGGAARGDRTMLDALLPAAEAFQSASDAGQPVAAALRAAATSAREGAQATAAMLPRRGRSSYLGHRALGHVDPGAEAVAIWLAALADTSRS
jgi:dihydroxyacetone kinase